MQQILNSHDRNQAFLKFLLFFIITIVLVVIAVYFNFRIPVKENKFLTAELENNRVQDQREAEFVEKMDKVVVMLDSMEKDKNAADQYTVSVSKQLGEMREYAPNNNLLYNKMNMAIIGKFITLNSHIQDGFTAAKDRDDLNKVRQSISKILSLVPAEQKDAVKQSFPQEIQYVLPAQ